MESEEEQPSGDESDGNADQAAEEPVGPFYATVNQVRFIEPAFNNYLANRRNMATLAYECPNCAFSNRSQRPFIAHLNVCANLRYNCSHCTASFRRDDNLAAHLQRYHY